VVNSWQSRQFNRGTGYSRRVDTRTMADRKNKLGLSVAIGAGVGTALGVALHHLPLWLSLGGVDGIVTGIILTRMTRSLILSRYFGSLNVLFVCMLHLVSHK
jgi:hypothetical protein